MSLFVLGIIIGSFILVAFLYLFNVLAIFAFFIDIFIRLLCLAGIYISRKRLTGDEREQHYKDNIHY